jgi:hypothetical protein
MEFIGARLARNLKGSVKKGRVGMCRDLAGKKKPREVNDLAGSGLGGRCRVRTCDLCRVKAVLYH